MLGCGIKFIGKRVWIFLIVVEDGVLFVSDKSLVGRVSGLSLKGCILKFWEVIEVLVEGSFWVLSGLNEVVLSFEGFFMVSG